ncbi:helix-turn-helix domain-containing protein, partial [Alteromonas sp. DY56-G5]
MCISQRTLKRWANNPTPDKRPTTAPVKQPRQLSEDEEQRILMVCNLPQYADLPASQIVPLLADKGVYIGSESTIYRVLKKHRQLTHRGKAKPRNKHPLPTS